MAWVLGPVALGVMRSLWPALDTTVFHGVSSADYSIAVATPVRPTYSGWQMSSCSEGGREPASGPPGGRGCPASARSHRLRGRFLGRDRGARAVRSVGGCAL